MADVRVFDFLEALQKEIIDKEMSREDVLFMLEAMKERVRHA